MGPGENQAAGISEGSQLWKRKNLIQIILLPVHSPKRSAIVSPILFIEVIKRTTNTCGNKKQTGIIRAVYQRHARFTTVPV